MNTWLQLLRCIYWPGTWDLDWRALHSKGLSRGSLLVSGTKNCRIMMLMVFSQICRSDLSQETQKMMQKLSSKLVLCISNVYRGMMVMGCLLMMFGSLALYITETDIVIADKPVDQSVELETPIGISKFFHYH